jgi:hypothetical protein
MLWLTGLLLPLLFVLMVAVFGMTRSLFAVALLALAVAPGHLAGPTVPGHTGIAGGALSLTTYMVPILIAALVYGLRDRDVLISRLWVPLIIYLAIGLMILWDGSPEHWSGAWLILTSIVAWGLGARYATEASKRAELLTWLALVCVGIASLQLLVELLQMQGSGIFALDAAAAEFESGRLNGTFAHPGTLGKVLLLLTFLLLPLTVHEHRWTRWLARLFLPIAFVATILTESRANIVSFVIVITFWGLLLPG